MSPSPLCRPFAVRICIVLVLFCGLTSSVTLQAQRFVDRGFITNPLFNIAADTEMDGPQFLPGGNAFGELFYTLDDTVQAWSQRLLYTAELVRFSADQTLSFNTNLEFVADPNNSINFNPRAIWFEENFLYTQRQAGWLWQLGYNHRCKHDLDNLTQNEQRGLIYGSVSGRIIATLGDEVRPDLAAALRADVYTLLADDRLPGIAEESGLDYENLAAGLSFSAHWHGGAGSVGFYARTQSSLNFFGTETGFSGRLGSIAHARWSGDIEAGLEIRGASLMHIGARLEHFHDAEINPVPGKQTAFSIGVRIFAPGGFL